MMAGHPDPVVVDQAQKSGRDEPDRKDWRVLSIVHLADTRDQAIDDCLYGTTRITERHRHRYEVNMAYRKVLEANGLLFSGVSPDGTLPEIVERTDHPWFIGVQFHPELKSKPFEPHPLFASFIAAAVEQGRLV